MQKISLFPSAKALGQTLEQFHCELEILEACFEFSKEFVVAAIHDMHIWMLLEFH